MAADGCAGFRSMVVFRRPHAMEVLCLACRTEKRTCKLGAICRTSKTTPGAMTHYKGWDSPAAANVCHVSDGQRLAYSILNTTYKVKHL